MALEEIVSYIVFDLIALAVGFVFGYYFVVKVFQKRLVKGVTEEVSKRVSITMRALADKQIEKALKKLTGFLLTPKVFLYLDEKVIDSLFSQIKGEEKTTGIERETFTETSKSINPDLQVVKGEYSKKGTKREKALIQIIDSPELKHDEVLGHLASHLAVSFDLETFSYDNKPDEEFLKSCAELEEKTGHDLPLGWKEEYLKINRSKQLEAKIREIDSAKGRFVLMQIDVSVKKDPEQENAYSLDFLHPINDLRNLEREPNVNFTVHVNLSRSHLTEIGAETFSSVKKVTLRIFGRLIDFDKQTGVIMVRPLSIY